MLEVFLYLYFVDSLYDVIFSGTKMDCLHTVGFESANWKLMMYAVFVVTKPVMCTIKTAKLI